MSCVFKLSGEKRGYRFQPNQFASMELQPPWFLLDRNVPPLKPQEKHTNPRKYKLATPFKKKGGNYVESTREILQVYHAHTVIIR